MGGATLLFLLLFLLCLLCQRSPEPRVPDFQGNPAAAAAAAVENITRYDERSGYGADYYGGENTRCEFGHC